MGIGAQTAEPRCCGFAELRRPHNLGEKIEMSSNFELKPPWVRMDPVRAWGVRCKHVEKGWILYQYHITSS